jgi:hypothetical protein
LERIDCLAKTNLLPLRECLEELEEIKKEARERGEPALLMEVFDFQIHHQNRQGKYLSQLRDTLSTVRRHLNNEDIRARCKAHSILATSMYFEACHNSVSSGRTAVSLAKQTNDRDLILHALNRLIVALLHGALLHTIEGSDALNEAERLSRNTGDLNLKFFVRLNRAVWLLDIGTVEPSLKAFEKTRRVIRGTNQREVKALFHANQGEAYIAAHALPEATREYAVAETMLSPASPDYLRFSINAGIGLCALLSGNLREAKRREDTVLPCLDFWTFDPYLVATFITRMMRTRGEWRSAEELLAQTMNDIRNRFVPAWMRLALERQRHLGKRDPQAAMEIIEEGRDVAHRLNLQPRSEDFDRARSRLLGKATT